MLFSCSNPDAVIQAMGSDDTLSGVIADSVVFYRSDSGIVNLELHTPRLVRMETDDDIMEFPLGFDVFMFDKGQKTTELHADYGKNYGKQRLIEAMGNVVVKNFGSNETMYSDKFFWYQDQKMIYTRSHVKIVTQSRPTAWWPRRIFRNIPCIRAARCSTSTRRNEPWIVGL